MSLVETDDAGLLAFRAEFRLPSASELSDVPIIKALARASRKVFAKIGEEVYAASEAELETEDISDMTEDLQDAEKFFAVSEIIMTAGIKLRRDGFVKKQQSTESAGMGSNNVNDEFFSFDEVKKRSEYYSSKAWDLMDEYLEDNAVGSDEIELIRG